MVGWLRGWSGGFLARTRLSKRLRAGSVLAVLGVATVSLAAWGRAESPELPPEIFDSSYSPGAARALAAAPAPAAVEDDPTPLRVSEMSAPGLPTRAAKKHVFLLLGGLSFMNGWAASVASAGMLRLQSSLAALPDVEVSLYDWRSFKEAGDDIALLPKDDIVIVIGYSGGGSRATWLANLPSEPKIDLMILYDPSPSWDMKVIGPNVKQAICYHNVTPFFFGLGGGVLVGNNTQIDTIDINENHMLVQTDTTLHQRTITEVKKIHR
jgi:hypothetical protein